jgi:hypothetical protein
MLFLTQALKVMAVTSPSHDRGSPRDLLKAGLDDDPFFQLREGTARSRLLEGVDIAQYDAILGLHDSDYTTVAVVATGYRSADDAMQHASKVRFDRSLVIPPHADKA